MDIFGIENHLQGEVRAYFLRNRRTGRTTKLVATVQSGDRVVCANEAEARHLREELRRVDKVGVQVVVAAADYPKLLGFSRSEGRTVFDHSWLEDFYTAEIKRSAQNVTELERRLSRYEIEPEAPAPRDFEIPTYTAKSKRTTI